MQFHSLTRGTLVRRYKRFLADVTLENGETVTAHVPNTGSLMGCTEPGRPAWLRYEPSPTRKYAYSLVLLKPSRALVCVDTGIPNRVVFESARSQKLTELAGYLAYKREVAYGERSRADLCCTGRVEDPAARMWVEVKSTTLVRNRVAQFPDAVTTRGRKHLVELGKAVAAGDRALQLFFVQRQDCEEFRPADDIDPDYGQELRRAASLGVELLALQAKVSTRGITIKSSIPITL